MSRHGRSWLSTRRSTAVALGGVERLEIADLALAEDEDAAAAQVGVESREREAGLLRVGDGDAAVEAVGAGQQLEIERAGVGQIAQHGRDRHAGRWTVRSPQPLALPDCCSCHGQSGSISP